MRPCVHTGAQCTGSQSQSQSQSHEPSLQRVIPARGPTSGGIEVTLLGSNFKEGLSVRFGDNLALSTQCWNESTMVTYLPPTHQPGQVLVTVEDPQSPDDAGLAFNWQRQQYNGAATTIFTYTDETDRQLIELALQIVGLKMNGKLEDARNVAKKIVGSDAVAGAGDSSQGPSPINGYSLANGDEQLIMQVLKSMNKATTHLAMCDAQGRTLLHLAALSGYYNLAAHLVSANVRIDSADEFGFTPLHFAAVSGDAKIIELLLNCSSRGSRHRAVNGATPLELYKANNKVISSVVDQFQKHGYGSSAQQPDLSRMSSRSSIDSHIFNDELNDAAERMDGGMGQYPPAHAAFQDLYSDSDNASDCDFEDNASFSEDESVAEQETGHDATEDTAVDPPSPSDVITDPKRLSLWNRMMTHLPDDLPTYDDLFPRLNSAAKSGDAKDAVVATVTSGETELSSQDVSGAASTSDEDEDEDVLQWRLNRFFAKQKKAFHNDRMLLFFWIPLTLLLLTFAIFNSLYGDIESSRISRFTNMVKSYLIVGLGKVWLGNQRMKNYVTENLNSFPKARKLNDLLVG